MATPEPVVAPTMVPVSTPEATSGPSCPISINVGDSLLLSGLIAVKAQMVIPVGAAFGSPVVKLFMRLILQLKLNFIQKDHFHSRQ